MVKLPVQRRCRCRDLEKTAPVFLQCASRKEDQSRQFSRNWRFRGDLQPHANTVHYAVAENLNEGRVCDAVNSLLAWQEHCRPEVFPRQVKWPTHPDDLS